MLKKALSPLIATILLVAVALSLAGILYSWSSQNVKSTTQSISDTSDDWKYCDGIILSLDGCSYSNEKGFSNLILFSKSNVEIDKNFVITIIDSEDTIKSTEVAPDFIGTAMNLSSHVNQIEGIKDLVPPLKKVHVHLTSCPDHPAFVNKCD